MRRRNSILQCTLAVLVVANVVSWAQSGTVTRDRDKAAGWPSADTPGFAPRAPRYELRPGDVLDLTFAFTPEFNQTLAVQPDGYLSLRGVGELYVQGKTLPQLTHMLQSEYVKLLHEPQISVVLKDFEKPHFIVAGEVGKPGKYELRADTTVMEAIGIAGSLTERAKHSQVLLFRRISDNWVEAKELNVKKLYAGDYREDIHLRPGDMIFVPQNRISKIKQFLPTSAVSTYVSPTPH